MFINLALYCNILYILQIPLRESGLSFRVGASDFTFEIKQTVELGYSESNEKESHLEVSVKEQILILKVTLKMTATGQRSTKK